MADSDLTRLSVAMVEVFEGREREFHDLATAMALLLVTHRYGRQDVIQDEAVPLRFYAIRQWTSSASAEACHADSDVRALMEKLSRVSRITYVLNGPPGSHAAGMALPPDRGQPVDIDRRSGFERRVAQLGRPEGDRRRGRERRGGLRQVHGRVDSLVAAAKRAREHASAQFSQFKVGAALETADGMVVTGCNVENATYGLTICAERVAMFKAISEGHRAFTRIAIVADTTDPTPPCGACRQILWEFGGDLEVRLANLTGEIATLQLKALLPLPFDARLL